MSLYDENELIRLQSVRDLQNPPTAPSPYDRTDKQVPPILATLIVESDALILSDEQIALNLLNMTNGGTRWDAGSKARGQVGAGSTAFDSAGPTINADFLGAATPAGRR